ncbi:hypothetical protein JIN78_15415, partial [Roseibacillus ishigakijimensis]
LRFEGLSGLPPGPDADLDGLSDSLENYLGTDPNQTDTDGDGMTDREEVEQAATNPTLADSDGDGIPDDQDPDSYPVTTTEFPVTIISEEGRLSWTGTVDTGTAAYMYPGGESHANYDSTFKAIDYFIPVNTWQSFNQAAMANVGFGQSDIDEGWQPFTVPRSVYLGRNDTGHVHRMHHTQLRINVAQPASENLETHRTWLHFSEDLSAPHEVILLGRAIERLRIPRGRTTSLSGEIVEQTTNLNLNRQGMFTDLIQTNTREFLLPVDISVTKEGEAAAPEDGLVVKKTDTVRYRLSPGLPDAPLLLEDKIQWHWRVLKWDGTYSAWTAYQDGQGHTFTAQPEDAGIYEVKATIDGQDFFLKRKKDDPHSAKKKDENDCFGVVDEQWQIDVRHEAKRNLGSKAYAKAVANPPFKAGSWKCNQFVGDKATDGGATVPKINGNNPFRKHYPIANQWSETNPKHIPNWTLLARATYPQPGWVIARGVTGGTGHTGIIGYDGAWINAGATEVNRKADLRNAYYNEEDPATPEGPARFRKYNP